VAEILDGHDDLLGQSREAALTHDYGASCFSADGEAASALAAALVTLNALFQGAFDV
jgi:hypothetical protein